MNFREGYDFRENRPSFFVREPKAWQNLRAVLEESALMYARGFIREKELHRGSTTDEMATTVEAELERERNRRDVSDSLYRTARVRFEDMVGDIVDKWISQNTTTATKNLSISQWHISSADEDAVRMYVRSQPVWQEILDKAVDDAQAEYEFEKL